MRTKAQRMEPFWNLDGEGLGIGVQTKGHVHAPRGDTAHHAESEELDIVPGAEVFKLAGQSLPEGLVFPLVYLGEGRSFARRSPQYPEIVVTVNEKLYKHDAVDDEVPCRERYLCDGGA